MMSHNPRDPNHHTAAEDLEDYVDTPLHNEVFGANPDGPVNDTPRGAIGANVLGRDGKVVANWDLPFRVGARKTVDPVAHPSPPPIRRSIPVISAGPKSCTLRPERRSMLTHRHRQF